MIAALLVFIVPATIAALYYFGLTMLPRRRARTPAQPTMRFAILIPAHNEELSLPTVLRSIAAIAYPPELISVTVVADNCTDVTAAIGRRAGVEVLERTSATHRGKGYALAACLDHILARRPDAVLILDADCTIAPDAVARLAARFAAGAQVIQTAVLYGNADDGPGGLAMAVGGVLDSAIAAGRDRLGLSVELRGMGMAFRSEVFERVPWTAFGLTEDAEYSAKLRAARIRVCCEPYAVVCSEAPARLADLCQQRRRWRSALFTTTLLRSWLESKPLVLTQLFLTTLIVVATLAWNPDPIAILASIWLGMLHFLTAAVYGRALYQVGLSRHRLKLLASVPGVVVRLLVVTLGGLLTTPATWERTRRNAERTDPALTPAIEH